MRYGSVKLCALNNRTVSGMKERDKDRKDARKLSMLLFR